MRLAISNIAWDTEEDEAIANLLQRYDVDVIDIAPGKYFPDPAKTSDQDVAAVKCWWSERGLEITGMQALLFGTTGLNVFGDSESRDAMLQHLGAVCRIGAGLGATRLVFGSPKNRDRTGLSDDEAMDAAVTFFRRLSNIATSQDVLICLEPNPPCYGANFMTTSAETKKVVKVINHPSIRMQLDTGAVTISDEDAAAVLDECAPLIGHVHASEPNLLPIGDGGCDHEMVARALRQYLPDHVVTIEMLATKDEPHEQSIERALKIAALNYRNNEDGAIT